MIKHTPDFHHPRRNVPVVSVVVHTTGDTDLAKVIHYYTTSSQGICPHYVIDLDGNVHQFVDEDHVAYHAGYGGEGADNQETLYRKGWDVWSRRINRAPWVLPDPYAGYAGWRVRWPGLNSPLELPLGEAPNGGSVGIELLSPKHRLPAVVTEGQYAAVAELARGVAERHGIPWDHLHVVGHEDCNPIARSDLHGGWDPGVSRGFDWSRVLGDQPSAEV